MMGTFHGTEYEILVEVSQNFLTLTLSSLEQNQKWSKRFEKEEIESLTERTKNSKKFNVFCKMLLGSLDNTSTSTLIDVLSPYDMELLRSRKLSEKGV